MYLNRNDFNGINGLGKFKLKKLLPSKKILKLVPKFLQKSPLAPLPIKAAVLLQKKKIAPAPAIAPAVIEPDTLSPISPEMQMPVSPPLMYQPLPAYQPLPIYQQPQPQFYQHPQQQFYQQPQPQPQFYEEPSPATLPEDYFPTQLDYGYKPVDEMPLITPYESAVASQFPSEEQFFDEPEAYESEAGYLYGLGQESGSTGGWFTDLISTGAKAAVEIAKAKAAAKAAKTPAPVIQPRTPYLPTVFGTGINLNTALMVGALGIGGFLLYNKFARKRR